DLAANMGWEYSLVDANWNIMQGGQIEDLIQYASTKHIGLALWYNSGGPHNNVTEQPRDIMNDPVKRKEEFHKLAAWGIKAVKVDFFQSDKQSIIQLYLDILRDAAKEKIMVIFHGCTIPRGWSRTYPNLLSMEAVKGAEQYGWDKVFADQAPQHNTILAFTRNVVGPMDYTPVTFSDYACCPHVTSNVHELALSVIFESGMLHFADSDSSYLSQSDRVKEILREVPNVWDDTKYLQGEPGKEIMVARRSGNSWWIACINGQNIAKQISVDFSFLGNGSYSTSIFSDGVSSREIQVRDNVYQKNSSTSIHLLPYGGFLIKLELK
ncbi:MAG TPA: glycoside hydrolase family 97 catalytic domain-containing protein, partial [Puia sp.]|nr:glycoside hydrolase family 97 catalytic domain-containing protein [Puia sp.]